MQRLSGSCDLIENPQVKKTGIISSSRNINREVLIRSAVSGIVKKNQGRLKPYCPPI
jgi:hypothetical protein